jgi:predicted O-methyltransferase YrrM
MGVDADARFSFCPSLPALMQAGESRGRSGRMHRNGFSTPNTLVTLRNVCMSLRPAHTLETGLAFGGSALVLAASHRDLGTAPAGQHVAIDPYQRSQWDEVGLVALENAGLRDYVDFRALPSSAALPALLEAGATFQLIYIDGSHLFEDVFIDAYYASRLLAENGVMIFDDSTDRHVRKVLSFIARNLAHALQPFDLQRFRSAPEQNVSYRLARLLGRVQLTAFKKIGSVQRPWRAPLKSF